MSKTPRNRLFLLDGMALIYRAHFAFITNPMRNAAGMNTSALFGFLNTLLQLKDEGKPTHMGVAFDTSEPTERHTLYPEYKANRQAMPEDLSEQIPHLFRLLEAFRLPIIRIPGYEADDTIGTLARQAEACGDYLTYMVTPDKDFGQLIDRSTFMWKPGRKGSEYTIIDIPALQEEWSIQDPCQIVDILALMGDSSDNIPGVPGIGPKTAKDLISTYGSVENLLEHLDDLKGKRKEVLAGHREDALLSKKLATINTEVPIPLALDELECCDPDEQQLSKLLDEFQFRALKKRILGAAPSAASKTEPEKKKEFPSDQSQPSLFERESLDDLTGGGFKEEPVLPAGELFEYGANREPEGSRILSLRTVPHTYHTVLGEEERRALARKLEKERVWSFDIETTGPDPLMDTVLGISFSLEPGVAYYVPVDRPEDLKAFRKAFGAGSEIIAHDLKYALSVLRVIGIEVKGTFFDTMLAHCLVAPGQKRTVDYLAESYLNYCTISAADAGTTKKIVVDRLGLPLASRSDEFAESADIIGQLAQVLKARLEQMEQLSLYENIEAPLIPVLAHMEVQGINVDCDALACASVKLESEINELCDRITEAAGHSFNLNSPKQLGTVLFDEMQLIEKPKKTKTGQYVTDEETLSSLAVQHPIVADILAYREASKLKGTYVDALPRFISPADGRIHTRYLQVMTTTGRMASQDPNLQNIPIRTEAGRAIRAAFIPSGPDYCLLSADYSQIELRVMAALSGDRALIKAFTTSRDIHTETAALLYGIKSHEVTANMRRAAKTVNFGIIYGISPFGLSQRLGIPRGQAAEIIHNYFTQFPGVKAFMDQLIAEAKEVGYVSTMNNRRRRIPEINSANANIRQGAERMAINTPIQGTAADMIKIAMVRVHQLLQARQAKTKLLLQIHDELLFDLHKEEKNLIPDIVDIMQNALVLPHEVPVLVEADTGCNWLEAH